MRTLFKFLFSLIFLLTLSSCNGQQKTTNATETTLSADFDESPPFSYKMPSNLTAQDTSPSFKGQDQKILLTGTVFEPDGKTPASDVILYYYQTNSQGVYATDPDEPRNMPKNRLGQTHGHIRGWIKTDAEGSYAIYTTQPGSYPNSNEPAHIHLYIKEKNRQEPYYADDFVFDNDPLLTSRIRRDMNNRCGSGVIRFAKKDHLLIGERNLYLGLNIPDYPVSSTPQIDSGNAIGEDVFSFIPYHAYGPDKGKTTCPVCKYGWYHGILYFVGNDPNWPDIKKWLTFLDAQSLKRKEYLKTYFVYGNNTDFNKQKRIAELEKLGDELQLKSIALTFVPSFSDVESEIHYNHINQNVENTFIIYRRSNIIGKYINLIPTQDNFDQMTQLLNNTANEYFKLPKPNN